MADNKWFWIWPTAFLVNKMQVKPINWRGKLIKPVDCFLLLVPVKFFNPIGTKCLHVIKINTVIPAAIIWHFMPGIVGNARLYSCYFVIRYIELVR